MIREYLIFGIIIWLFYKMFPSKNEVMKSNFENTNRFDGLFFFFSRIKYKLNLEFERMEKKAIQTLKRKKQISLKLLSLIGKICEDNQKNQEYFKNFITLLSKYTGYMNEVSLTMITCIKNNVDLLQILYFPFNNKKIDKIDNSDKDFTLYLIKSLANFKNYTKYEILDLLATLCKTESKAIYLNQDKIYKNLIEIYHKDLKYFIRIKDHDDSFSLEILSDENDFQNPNLQEFCDFYKGINYKSMIIKNYYKNILFYKKIIYINI